jgi:hypothetical protein
MGGSFSGKRQAAGGKPNAFSFASLSLYFRHHSEFGLPLQLWRGCELGRHGMATLPYRLLEA